MLTQQVNFSYQQQINRIYEIGSNTSFYVAGRTQGNMNVSRILGPRKIATQFYTKYGDVCQAATNNLDIQMATGCSKVGEFAQNYAFGMKYSVMTSIGVSMQAQDMMINEQLQLMFSSLTMKKA